jgi:uncharacterized membrane protein YoaT (DUF817 family)
MHCTNSATRLTKLRGNKIDGFNSLDHFFIYPLAVEAGVLQRFFLEFFWFGLKEARACLFADLIFLAIFTIPHSVILGIARYDVLLIFALTIQSLMIITKLESWTEVRVITLFHFLGFGLVVFKT